MIEDTRTHNIVVCCDGTWCGTETGTRGNIQVLADAFASKGLRWNVRTKDNKSVPTNKTTNTDVRYFNGVGLDGWEDLLKERKLKAPLVTGLVGSFANTLLYIKNCVVARDLPERCKEAYSFIADTYKGPDSSRVWLFGMSRGAYTVRAVAGMINNCGILDFRPLKDLPPAQAAAAKAAAVDEVYNLYRSGTDEDKPNAAKMKAFRAEKSWPRGSLPPVVFMGLLDTVGTRGMPSVKLHAPAPDQTLTFPESDKARFYDTKVSSEVQQVFQAAAAHDRFGPFKPCPVRRDSKLAAAEADKAGGYTGHYPGVKFTTQEVWFPGAHYDLGRQDFVFGDNPYLNHVNKEINLLSSNVKCSQELADYPLIGHALPAHQPLAGSRSSSSSSSSSCGAGVTSSLCLVDLANSIQPEILPASNDDRAWQVLVDGNFGSDAPDSIIERALLGAEDLGLWGLKHMGAFWFLRKATGVLPLLPPTLKLCQPPYSIDAETFRLGPVAGLLAKALGTTEEWVLRDREIPLPPKDEDGLPVGEATFFKVPFDAGGDCSYRARGRQPVWFSSRAFDTYQDDLKAYKDGLTTALTQQAAGSSSQAAGGTLAADAGKRGAVDSPRKRRAPKKSK